VAAHAGSGGRRKTHNRRRVGLREVHGLGEDGSLHHRQLPVPLDPHGTEESLRHHRPPLRTRHGGGGLEDHGRKTEKGRVLRLFHHPADECQGHVHHRRPGGRSGTAPAHPGAPSGFCGGPHLPARQGPGRGKPCGLEPLSGKARRRGGDPHPVLRGLHRGPGKKARVFPFHGGPGHGPRPGPPLRRGSGPRPAGEDLPPASGGGEPPGEGTAAVQGG